ncbi:Ribosomal protein [Trema orientale]|uniref:Ribosomal protein n=1 Tax=Trema orientale TaxID=63057 RepID=A0A2P5FHE8_TREOI|nr:Ribosomal protein [Trema orientale]
MVERSSMDACEVGETSENRFILSELGEEVKALTPESVLKKKREEEWALAKTQQLQALKVKNAENRKLIYKEPSSMPRNMQSK